MPLSLPHLRRPISALPTLALALGVLALALLAPSQALAKSRGSACSRPAGSHVKRRGHSCASMRHRARKRRTRHGAAPHAARPAGKNAKGESKRAPSSPPPATRTTVAASCEDGSEPRQVDTEVYECTDGSEPRCDDGGQLTISTDGARLVCADNAFASEGSDEAECQGLLTLPEEAEGSPGPGEDATPVCSVAPEGAEEEE